ncbi:MULTISPECIES: hydrogen peroxide-inducible genes activator [Kordiimonas]|uniref:LysR family transcriptional regulator, hydrogen peroxide-inducible genes activator n=1 Tax=Kordiimonas lacus TaxID=637679 RepID=A0A1G6TZ43_9PROT|nr:MULTISPECIES: hydrogen peroxide-inducible genes activator [Kordiimonas]SDD34359.1 LysR family transcriptional regulator, hydrogen peroxide-inducible genes activator [Kordiimonas lacus]
MADIGYPTLKQLMYLQAVIKEGSFRAASQKLGVSQPTITSQIAALEETLGMVLLERSRSGTIPTAAGRDLIPHITNIETEVNGIREQARFASTGGSGVHRLGVPPTLGPYFLPEVLSEVHTTDPTLRLYVREGTPRELENGLLDGRYDLILTTMPVEIGGLVVEPLFGEPFKLCAPPDHPLVGKGKVDASAIKGERLLAIEERHRLFEQMQAMANQFGARLMRDYEGTSLDTVRQMIGTGFGLAFLPALYIRSEIAPRNDVTVLEMSETPSDRDVVLAWRPTAAKRQLYRSLASQMRRICRDKLADCLHVAAPQSTSVPGDGDKYPS